MQKILIIDDAARLVKNVETDLKEFGYRIVAALNGAEGLRKVQALQPDLMMPGLDGLEVCREIRKGSTVPILMLTARGEESDMVSGLEVSADDYLTKPFSLLRIFFTLLLLIHRAVGKRQQFLKGAGRSGIIYRMAGAE
jgi:DNA-binding response OmpR family regulator